MRKFFKNFYMRFISLRGDPKKIAMGFAVGVMISFFPIVGTHTMLSIVFSSIFRLHMAAMFTGTWFGSNPITIVPMFAGEFFLGKHILGMNDLTIGEIEWTTSGVLSLGWDVLSCLFVGWLIIGAFFAFLSFPACLNSIKKMRRKQKATAS